MRIMVRRSMAAAVTVGVALMFTACTSDPTPTDTPTPTAGFATEEEAFAAAEETYREYNDLVNGVDLSDPSTFEPVYSMLAGQALANERASLSQLHADSLTKTGSTVVTDFYGATTSEGTVQGIACLNVSAVDLVDASGASQVGSDRRDVYALDLTFNASGGHLVLVESVAIEDERC